jgi:hypothetical protein
MTMKRTIIVSIIVSMSLAFVLSAVLPLFKIEPVYAQSIDNSLAEKQRLGTNNIFSPQGVHILFGNGQNATLDLEFIVLGSNNNTSQGAQNGSVVFKNPDYGLSDTNAILSVGQNFRINSTTDQDLKYTSANVRLVPIASLPPGTKLSDIDPETDLIQQTPLISLGSYQGGVGTFVIPQTTRSGYYIIDVSLHYPSLGMTTVHTALVRITSGGGIVSGGTTPRALPIR